MSTGATHSPDSRGTVLLWLARAAIEEAFGGSPITSPREPWLRERAATFVTLRHARTDDLRGCVGGIESRRPLAEDVMASARAAAFRDSRFPPLSAEELDQMRISISVLSPLARLPVSDEKDAVQKLRKREHGVVLSYGAHNRGLFLPKVWEELPDGFEFLAHLKMKAGLAPDFWSRGIELQTFTAQEYSE